MNSNVVFYSFAKRREGVNTELTLLAAAVRPHALTPAKNTVQTKFH